MVRTFPSGTYGAVSENLCAAYYSKLGYIVSRPITGDSKYDLLIDDGNSIQRVQCKTSFAKKKYPTSNLRRVGKKKPYMIGDFDILWVLTNNGIYLMNVSDIPSKDGALSEFAFAPKYNAFLIEFPVQLSPSPIKYLNNRDLPEKEIARVVSLTKLGVPLRVISTVVGMSQNAVMEIAKTHGAHFQHPLTDQIRKDIIKMYEKCIPVPTIAEILGYKHAVVNRVIKEHYAKLPKHRAPRLSGKDRDKVSQMRSSGATLSEIVEALEDLPK